MKKVYSHPDFATVQLARNELENAGIECFVRGEHLAGVAGGGAGFNAWVELWVADDEQLDAAREFVQQFIQAGDDAELEPWTCPTCGEKIDAPFGECWNCGTERDA